MDSSTTSLNTVLLHNVNKLPIIHIGHSDKLKEDYFSVKFFLQSLQYTKYKWGF